MIQNDDLIYHESVVVPPACAGMRIDRFIAEGLGLYSRSQLKVRLDKVFINGRESKKSHRVRSGDEVHFCVKKMRPQDVIPEPIPLEILFENSAVLLVNKPQGMVVHPARGNFSNTIVNALLYHYEELKTEFGDEELRPGIVHRLDKDTSGVLIVGKTASAHAFLATQFKSRRVRKTYLAIVKGTPRMPKARIKKALRRSPTHRKRFICVSHNGKMAITDFVVLRSYERYSFLKVMPQTGRTHQIRVHLKSIGCPVLGDALYSRRDAGFPVVGLMLHAYKLNIFLPGENRRRTFRAPLPERFKTVLANVSQ